MVGRAHGACETRHTDTGFFQLPRHGGGFRAAGFFDALGQRLHHELHAHVHIVVLRLGKALPEGLVKALRISARRVRKPIRHRNHLTHAGLGQHAGHTQRVPIKSVELTFKTHFLGSFDQEREVIAEVAGQNRLRATLFDLDGVGQKVLDARHRVQLVADDLHVGPLLAQLLSGFAQHRLTKAVVLPDQVNAFERLVVLEHIHQRGHAHVGMRVKTKVPEAALFVGQGRLHRRVIEKQHPLGRLALVVLVDGVNQNRRGGRGVALRNDANAVVNRRT